MCIRDRFRRLFSKEDYRDTDRMIGVEGVEAGLDMLGDVGDRPIPIERRGLGDNFAGEELMGSFMEDEVAVDGDTGIPPPEVIAYNNWWKWLVKEGFYDEAAAVSANTLPRDAAKLSQKEADGDIYAFYDVGDGSFQVQLTKGGKIYPVYALDGEYLQAHDR